MHFYTLQNPVFVSIAMTKKKNKMFLCLLVSLYMLLISSDMWFEIVPTSYHKYIYV